jgi:MFS family permease
LQPPKPLNSLHLSVLRQPDYRWLWAAGGVSNACRWMETATAGLLVLVLTDSPWQVALVGVCRSAPLLAFGLFAGFIADRMDRWRVMLLTAAVGALDTAVLLGLLVGGWLQPWHVFVGTFILGCGTILDMPSRRSLIYDLVGPSHLVSAMSLETINNTLGKFLGPLVGGFVVELAGFEGLYLLLLLAYLLTAGLILRVQARRVASPAGRQPIWRSLAGGIRYAWHDRVVLGVLGTTVIMNALAFSYVQLLPVVARDHLQVGPGLMGLLAAADGLGTLVGALALATLGRTPQQGRIFLLGSLLELAGLLGFALSPWYGLSFLLLVAVGMGNAGFSTMQSTIVLLSAAPGMRGRAVGILGLCIGATPLGLLELGALATLVPAPTAIGLNATAALILLLPIMTRTPLLRGSAAADIAKGKT